MAEPRKQRDSWEAILADAERHCADNPQALEIIREKNYCKIGVVLFSLWQKGDEPAEALYKRLQALPFLYEEDDTFFMMMARNF